MKHENTSLYLLFAGMLLGLGLALVTLIQGSTGSGLPDTAVARVNERFISQDDYARALAAVVADSQQPLTQAQRRRVLDRLIDEELLIQYGMEQGLVRSDRRVRANLVSAVIEAKSVEAETRDISDAQAQAFYVRNQAYFTQAQQLQVVILQLADAARAAALRAQWLAEPQTTDWPQAERLIHIPPALLPLAKLRQLAGATLAEAAAALAPGAISQPLGLNDNWYLIRLVQRVDAAPAFTNVAEQVKAEMRRRAAEQAVNAALARQREVQQVLIAEERL